jgi:hypothetical protein
VVGAVRFIWAGRYFQRTVDEGWGVPTFVLPLVIISLVLTIDKLLEEKKESLHTYHIMYVYK